jgi:hypothetical protein
MAETCMNGSEMESIEDAGSPNLGASSPACDSEPSSVLSTLPASSSPDRARESSSGLTTLSATPSPYLPTIGDICNTVRGSKRYISPYTCGAMLPTSPPREQVSKLYAQEKIRTPISMERVRAEQAHAEQMHKERIRREQSGMSEQLTEIVRRMRCVSTSFCKAPNRGPTPLPPRCCASAHIGPSH